MKEFLNPKSMLTPGIAGTTMMFIVNGVCAAFPEISPRYLAIFLSFMLASCVLKTVGMSIMQRGFYWVMNSLVIFVVGFGTTNIGRKIETGSPTKASSVVFVRSAYAGESDAAVNPDSASSKKTKPKEGNKSASDDDNVIQQNPKEDRKPNKKAPYFLEW